MCERERGGGTRRQARRGGSTVGNLGFICWYSPTCCRRREVLQTETSRFDLTTLCFLLQFYTGLDLLFLCVVSVLGGDFYGLLPSLV